MAAKRNTRYELLGVDETIFMSAIRQLGQATDLLGHSIAARAERFGVEADDLQQLLHMLSGSKALDPHQRRTLARIAAGPVAPLPVPRHEESATRGRRDVIAAGRTPVVYVTSSGRSGVWHTQPGCPLLDRGQAAAATMGKQVWPIEATSQAVAEAEGREPCTHCVPNVGSATLLAGRPTQQKGGGSRTAAKATPSFARSSVSVGGPLPGASKAEAKRRRDRAAAAKAGITVEELRLRRRREAEANAAAATSRRAAGR